MTRNAFIDRQRKLIVFWSPKCGCTTVARWFIHGVLQETQAFRASGQHALAWLDVHGHYLGHPEAYPLAVGGGYHTVLFTRNPQARLASAFINKFYVSRGDELRSITSLEPFARSFLQETGLVGGPAESYAGISFQQFVEALTIARRTGRRVDHHWDTQFPLPSEYVLRHPTPDHVVRLEALEADFAAVASALGIPPPKHVGNRTEYPDDFRESPAFLGTWTTADLLQARVAVRPANLYDPALARCVGDLFASDYERLPYVPSSA